ncbi:MAG TPA: hypothetical protein VGJ53_20650 [Micromonosporaceae bacterium]|jgi:hypothetical protein
MGRWRTRAAILVAGAAAFTVLGAGSAWAHECYNASRSDQGDTAAGTHSQAWFQLVISDAIAEDVANGLYTAEQGECIYAAWTAGGGPASFTIHVKGVNGQDGVLAEHNPNDGLVANGRGIDHLFDAYGELLVSSFLGCGVNPPV